MSRKPRTTFRKIPKDDQSARHKEYQTMFDLKIIRNHLIREVFMIIMMIMVRAMIMIMII